MSDLAGEFSLRRFAVDVLARTLPVASRDPERRSLATPNTLTK